MLTDLRERKNISKFHPTKFHQERKKERKKEMQN